MTGNDRPMYMERALDSWSMVRGEVDMYIRLEPGRPDVVEVTEEFGYEPIVNRTKLGVLSNVWRCLDDVFNDGADFAVVAEDDVLVSNDIIEYMEWARDEYRDDDEVLAVISTQRWFTPGEAEHHTASKRSEFAAPSWGVWADRWFEVLRDDWTHDYAKRGWDWWLRNELIEAEGFKTIVPHMARCQHIGVTGTHMQQPMFKDSLCESYRESFDDGVWHEQTVMA